MLGDFHNRILLNLVPFYHPQRSWIVDDTSRFRVRTLHAAESDARHRNGDLGPMPGFDVDTDVLRPLLNAAETVLKLAVLHAAPIADRLAYRLRQGKQAGFLSALRSVVPKRSELGSRCLARSATNSACATLLTPNLEELSRTSRWQ